MEAQDCHGRVISVSDEVSLGHFNVNRTGTVLAVDHQSRMVQVSLESNKFSDYEVICWVRADERIRVFL